MLEALGIPSDHGHHFVSADGKGCLSQEIINRFHEATRDEKDGIKQALRTFFGENKVLPMTGDTAAFFPDWWRHKGTEVKLLEIWDALLRFEVFCLVRLELGAPVFIPVMPISRARGRAEISAQAVEISKLLHLGEYNFPLLTSLEMPATLIGTYFEVFRFQQRIRQHLSKDAADEEKWHRIPWEHFDWTLKVYDFSLAQAGESKIIPRYRDFCKPERAKGEGPKRRQRKKKLQKRKTSTGSQIAEVEYHTHLRRAKRWIDQYIRII